MTKFLYHRRTHGAPKTPLQTPEPVAAKEPKPPAVHPADAAVPEPSYRCVMCGKSFGKAAQLARHQRFVHRLERRHEC
ncbi:ZN574 protein, partial [Caloenas nicobarica]|nr:ZN574 protein [Caloenas nicobarica]